MARTSSITRDEVQGLIQACFSDLAAQVNDGFQPKTSQPDLERDYQRAMTEVHSALVEGQLETGQFDQPVDTEALLILQRAGIEPDAVSSERFDDLRSGVARALLERDRLFLFRMSERLRLMVEEAKTDFSTDPFKALQSMAETVSMLQAQKEAPNIVDFKEALTTLWPYLQGKWLNKDTMVEFGWPYLDGMCGGLRPGDLISMVGRPQQGKLE